MSLKHDFEALVLWFCQQIKSTVHGQIIQLAQGRGKLKNVGGAKEVWHHQHKRGVQGHGLREGQMTCFTGMFI